MQEQDVSYRIGRLQSEAERLLSDLESEEGTAAQYSLCLYAPQIAETLRALAEQFWAEGGEEDESA